MKTIHKVRAIIEVIEEAAFTISAAGLVGLTVVSVFMRYALSSPIAWSEEIQMILIVWLMFFGGSIAFRMKGHIAIDLLVNVFSKKLQDILNPLIWILVTIGICWIFKLEFARMLKLMHTGQMTTMLKIPKYINYGVVVFACALMIINHFLNGIEGMILKVRGAKGI